MAQSPVDEGSGFELLGEGFSSRVLRSPDGIIFRQPKSHAAAKRQERLASILPIIADRVHVPIPIPQEILAPSSVHPFGAMAYAELSGVTMPATLTGDSGVLAQAVGSFLATLHEVSPDDLQDDHRDLIPKRADVDSRRESVMKTALSHLRDTQLPTVHARISRWWEGYRWDRRHSTFHSSFVHGDFWYENILLHLDQSRLVGVLDWEEIAFDDPAQDFATLLHSGEEFCSLVIDAYRDHGGHVEVNMLERRQWHWEYREFTGLAMALDVQDTTEVTDAMRKLKSGPLRHLFMETT